LSGLGLGLEQYGLGLGLGFKDNICGLGLVGENRILISFVVCMYNIV